MTTMQVEDEPRSTDRKERGVSTRSGEPLVLIVEDDPWIRGISSVLLEDEGFAIASAPDGEAGLNMAERLRPAAILLDLGLPRMSGAEFLRRLRSRDSLRRTPVIVVSGQSGPVSQGVTALADAFLRKPVDLAELMHHVGAATAATAPHEPAFVVGA